jgi:hypothetical protein
VQVQLLTQFIVAPNYTLRVLGSYYHNIEVPHFLYKSSFRLRILQPYDNMHSYFDYERS